MKSMTGFGKSSYIDDSYELAFELRSVNSKGFQLNLYCYKELLFLENEIKDFIYKKVRRGKLDLKIAFKDKAIPEIEIDEDRLRAYYGMLTKVKDILSINQDIRLETIINSPQAISIKSAEYDTGAFREFFFHQLDVALAEHQKMAIGEGTTLCKFFIGSMDTIQSSLTAVEQTIPAYREKLKENLTASVRQLLAGEYTDDMEKRILLETALYMERCNITEEMVRLRSHISAFIKILAKTDDEIGKSLNFILQEMHREVNTISSKYNTTQTYMEVLKMKEEVEKCKEQIQNVE
jgi:uncharacterized protein (TIGR00255 family)